MAYCKTLRDLLLVFVSEYNGACSHIAVMSLPVRFDPYSKTGFAICRICKSSVHQSGSHYCQGCAYKKGMNSLKTRSQKEKKWSKISGAETNVKTIISHKKIHIHRKKVDAGWCVLFFCNQALICTVFWYMSYIPCKIHMLHCNNIFSGGL